MKSRRQFLAGAGTIGVASLAGCSGLPMLGSDERDRPDFAVPTDAIPTLEWPASPFPVEVPDALADAHRERATELLEAVPANPSIPNGAVAEELRADHEDVVDQLEDEPDEPWPVDGLSWWRGRRGSAANVAAAYRAATGESDASRLADRRRTVREELGSFTATHEYRAGTTREAVLVHAPLEDLLSSTRRRISPDPGYPADPVAEPFQAGDAVERVEIAAGMLADARRLRETYLESRSSPRFQWERLIDASDRLQFAVYRTRQPVNEFLDIGRDAFDRDLDRTPAYELFTAAARVARSADDDFAEDRDDGAYATAVLDAGEALAGMDALRTAIEGIRDGGYQDEVTLDSLERTARRARDAIDDIRTAEHGALAALLARPVLWSYDAIPDRIEEGYADPLRLQGELAWIELYARAVPPATEFVSERLDGGS